MVQSFRQIVGASPSKVDIKTSALVIIDAQNEYASGQLTVSNVSSSRKAISSVLEKYRSNGGEIFHILHQTPDGAPVFTPNTHLAQEFDELAPKSGETVIKKQAPSSFTNTNLHEKLEEKGIKQVVLTGYMAHVCVTGTARSAMELGYDTIIVEDAVGDRQIPGASGEEVTKMVMLELGDAIGTIVQSNDIE